MQNSPKYGQQRCLFGIQIELHTLCTQKACTEALAQSMGNVHHQATPKEHDVLHVLQLGHMHLKGLHLSFSLAHDNGAGKRSMLT